MRLLTAATAVLIALAVAAPGAVAQAPPDGQGSDRFVTIVARQCPTYEDITANRARNDIQESLRDLGADTKYTEGQPIDPRIEGPNQPNCTPMPTWRFTLGTGYQTQAVEGPWGNLSIVTSPYSTDVVTQSQVPLLDFEGRPIPGATIASAVTIELTKEQAERAADDNSLWIQGGTTADPILDDQYPGQYGFGALRCAIDNLNGDNVEWIAYPSGTEHVFCYAYYVRPPPTSGTVIVRKEVKEPEGLSQTFEFQGNLTYNVSGRFDLTAQAGNPASETFYRGATTGPGGTGSPWTVREIVPAGWTLEDLSCVSEEGTSTTGVAGAQAVIDLAAEDTVTCTYTNAFRVPAGRLLIAKVTRGATGIFDFDIFPPGSGDPLEARAETRRPGLPVLARPSPLEVSPGLYRIREDLPESRRGSWRLEDVWCTGTGRQPPGDVTVRVRDQAGAGCFFRNRFIPRGGLIIDKTTSGGVGSFDYAITPLRDLETVYHQSATTTKALRPVRAKGDSTRNIALGAYVIQELAPEVEDGVWALGLVVCDGRIQAPIEGRVVVRLTTRNPVKRCIFLNLFTPDPPDPPDPPGPGPGPTPDPGPDPPGPNPAPHLPDPDLVISKQADRPVAAPGERLSYTVTVRNRGPVAAEDVVLGEAPDGGEAYASVSGPGSKRCGRHVVLGRNAVVCRVGDLAAGASRTLHFETRVTGGKDILNNVAVVGSATPETTARNNVAVARVRVRSVACVSAFGSLARPIARAAC